MTLAAKRGLSFVSLSLLCLFSASGAGATVFRDRAAFEAAAQNLHTLDFESVGPFDWWRDTIDGLHFGVVGLGARVSTWPGVPGKVLVSVGVPEMVVLQKISIYTRYWGGGTFLDATNCSQNIFCNTTHKRMSEGSKWRHLNGDLFCFKSMIPGVG